MEEIERRERLAVGEFLRKYELCGIVCGAERESGQSRDDELREGNRLLLCEPCKLSAAGGGGKEPETGIGGFIRRNTGASGSFGGVAEREVPPAECRAVFLNICDRDRPPFFAELCDITNRL